MYSLYAHIFPNGKKYIGVTKNSVKRRWQCGNGYKMQPKIYRAIMKYGWDNIEHKILATNLTKEEASILEQFFICCCRTTEPCFGYNDTFGGEYSFDMSEEVKLKLSENQRGSKNHNYNKKFSAITRLRMSEAQKGSKNHNFGKTLSKELRAKLSTLQSGENNPMFGKFHSDYTKDIIRIKAKERWRNGKYNNHYKGVSQYTVDCKFIRDFDSIIEASNYVGGNTSNIIACCRGKQKTAYSFIWKYKYGEEIEV